MKNKQERSKLITTKPDISDYFTAEGILNVGVFALAPIIAFALFYPIATIPFALILAISIIVPISKYFRDLSVYNKSMNNTNTDNAELTEHPLSSTKPTEEENFRTIFKRNPQGSNNVKSNQEENNQQDWFVKP